MTALTLDQLREAFLRNWCGDLMDDPINALNDEVSSALDAVISAARAEIYAERRAHQEPQVIARCEDYRGCDGDCELGCDDSPVVCCQCRRVLGCHCQPQPLRCANCAAAVAVARSPAELLRAFVEQMKIHLPAASQAGMIEALDRILAGVREECAADAEEHAREQESSAASCDDGEYLNGEIDMAKWYSGRARALRKEASRIRGLK